MNDTFEHPFAPIIRNRIVVANGKSVGPGVGTRALVDPGIYSQANSHLRKNFLLYWKIYCKIRQLDLPVTDREWILDGKGSLVSPVCLSSSLYVHVMYMQLKSLWTVSISLKTLKSTHLWSKSGFSSKTGIVFGEASTRCPNHKILQMMESKMCILSWWRQQYQNILIQMLAPTITLSDLFDLYDRWIWSSEWWTMSHALLACCIKI